MKTIKWCKGCTTPNTRPRIEYDEHGFCNACQRGDEKKDINWAYKEEDFRNFINKKISENPEREYDCIVPVSGGKDSHFQTWYAKNVLKLSVLAVAVEPLIMTQNGIDNRDNLARAIGVDMIIIKANPQVYAKLTAIMFKDYGNPYIPFLYLVFSACAKIAIEKKIPLFLYGENGETEYGGSTSELYSKLDADGIHARILGNSGCPTPDKWAQVYDFDPSDIIPYQEPGNKAFENANAIRMFMSDFIPWNNNYAFNASLNKIRGFTTSHIRTPGSYTFGYGLDDKIDHLYLWLMWPKFGYHRSSKYAAKDIREGKLNYKGAIELVKLYDGEFPWEFFDDVLKVLNLSENEFWDIAKKFVADEENLKEEAKRTGKNLDDMIVVWKKIEEGKWKHLNTIHGEERILEIPIKRPINK